MKKIVCFIVCLFALVSCQTQKEDALQTQSPALQTPPKVYYTDWDRAIRADMDMQNMYLNTPRKLKRPIDMYMAMALAVKYNYSRRLVSYEESLIKAGEVSYAQMRDVLGSAGYINTNNSANLNPELKVAWNLLDMSSVYCQDSNCTQKQGLAAEQRRKVIHNVLQQARVLYWKTLTAQRLLPVIDDMTEYMVLEVDEMNASAKELAAKGEVPSRGDLQKKRKYMEAVKNLTTLKRELETAQTDLASLMGLHPSTEFQLVGTQYGNFELPEIKSTLHQLEFMALTNRPELRAYDLTGVASDKELIIQNFNIAQGSKCKKDVKSYGRCSKASAEYGYAMIEDLKKASPSTLETLRRERMTSLVLNQVYVSWAQYMAATEDYQINMEISETSENIAEDLTFTNGAKNERSQLEAARAIEDEVKTFLSYVDVQEALGNLYATLGLDAFPDYMLYEKPSDIALYLRSVYEKWAEGDLMPDNRPYLLDIPAKRPPMRVPSNVALKDFTVETGEPFYINVPLDTFDSVGKREQIKTYAGLIDDAPLPKWVQYEPEKYRFNGRAMPGDGGVYNIKVYGADEKGSVAYGTFKLTVRDVYKPSREVRGLTEGRQAIVLTRCQGKDCDDAYVHQQTIGQEVEKAPIR